jgi:hypothetical protein
VRLVRGGVRPHQSDQKTALSRIRTAKRYLPLPKARWVVT